MNKTIRKILEDMECGERTFAHVRAISPEADIFWREPETLSERRAMRALCRSGDVVPAIGSDIEQYRLSKSVVSGVTLIFNLAEEKDFELISLVNEWLASISQNALVDISDHYGGRKHPQLVCLGAGLNFLEEDEF